MFLFRKYLSIPPSTLTSSGSKVDIFIGYIWFDSFIRVEKMESIGHKCKGIVNELHINLHEYYPNEKMHISLIKIILL